jgi:hypothetical protein
VNKILKIPVPDLGDLGTHLRQCLTDPQLQSLGEAEIICGEFKVRVHRAVLRARCPDLLEEIDEGNSQRLDLTGLWPPEVVKSTLLYAYSGSYENPSSRQAPGLSGRDMPALCTTWGLPPQKQRSRDKSNVSKSPSSPQRAEASLLGASFSHLVDNDEESDVRFSLQSHSGKTVHVYGHRVLLAARSEYFQKMFFSGFREGQRDGKYIDVKVPKSAECYRLLLEGLYTGSVVIPETMHQETSGVSLVAREVFEAGDEYLLEGFESLADDLLLLGTEVTKDNVAELAAMSRTGNLEPLSERCRNFLAENLGSLLDNRALWQSLPFYLKEKAWERCENKKHLVGSKALKTHKHVPTSAQGHRSLHCPVTEAALSMMSSGRSNGIDRTARCLVDCGPA